MLADCTKTTMNTGTKAQGGMTLMNRFKAFKAGEVGLQG
jgi:hypothetical protein